MSCLRCGRPAAGELCIRCMSERVGFNLDRVPPDPVSLDQAAAAGAKAKDDAEQWDGLRCPRCNCGHLPVFYTRQRGKNRIMRVRKCRNCGHKMTTYERFA
jgi:hypothetical protein